MLNVQKYLLENGLQSLKDNYGVITKEYDNLVVINYSQIDSPKNDPITDECRGLILSADFSKVLCRSFDRFYNLGEADQKVDNIEDYTILEKYDGCCEYNTKVETLEHGIMEIGEIVSNKINCHVKSYNLETNEIVYSNIIGFSEKSEIND
ncbi:MAG: RNA ligase [archaeon]